MYIKQHKNNLTNLEVNYQLKR